ncbi:MAG TPA: hypothetical protein PLW44_12705, partial [Chitinophagales bacterium]|nr:hypothetical protein [Chitinophagales bacterium]
MKTLCNIFVLVAAMLCFMPAGASPAPNSNGPDSTGTEEGRNLKILSWNIYMLPNIVPGKESKIERAHAIVEELKKDSFDVIVFQEAFLTDARTIISEGLKDKYPYAYGPANSGGFTIRASSGVWVISKIEL